MHTVELLENALSIAKLAGIQVRLEWLDGASSGFCRIGKQNWLFVDVSLSAAEQLEQVLSGLHHGDWEEVPMHPQLRELLLATDKSSKKHPAIARRVPSGQSVDA